MSDTEGKKKQMNISIDLPEDIAAIIEHESIMRNRSQDDILQEIVQKMFDDNGKEIADTMKE